MFISVIPILCQDYTHTKKQHLVEKWIPAGYCPYLIGKSICETALNQAW